MITKRVKDYSKNRSDLTTYYNVGKLLSEAGKHYGEGIINEYSKRLTNELGKGYGLSNLKRMRQFYWLIEKGAPLVHQLTWSHYLEVLPIKDYNAILYYIDLCITQSLSKRELRFKIKNKEYERLDNITKKKLIAKEEATLVDFIKNPIVIKNGTNKEVISEKLLQKIILGFTFVENEYRIRIGSNYNYIDLLLYNYIFNCFVVVELKVTELKKEYIGQIEVYIT